MKITQEQKDEMKALSSTGMFQRDIAKALGITQGSVSYWIGKGTREKRISAARKRFLKLTKALKQKYYSSRRDYLRVYCKNRYNSDSLYKEKVKERVRNWKKENLK